MTGKLTVIAGDRTLTAELYDTPTAREILANLPLEGKANLWGDEIYFSIPLQLEQEPDARCVVEVGELGYWPAGPAFCIFFGPTPVSEGDEPRAYSPVNVFGRIEGDATCLKGVRDRSLIRIR